MPPVFVGRNSASACLAGPDGFAPPPHVCARECAAAVSNEDKGFLIAPLEGVVSVGRLAVECQLWCALLLQPRAVLFCLLRRRFAGGGCCHQTNAFSVNFVRASPVGRVCVRVRARGRPSRVRLKGRTCGCMVAHPLSFPFSQAFSVNQPLYSVAGQDTADAGIPPPASGLQVCEGRAADVHATCSRACTKSPANRPSDLVEDICFQFGQCGQLVPQGESACVLCAGVCECGPLHLRAHLKRPSNSSGGDHTVKSYAIFYRSVGPTRTRFGVACSFYHR